MLRDSSQSAIWLERARKSLTGGVNSPVRAFKAVGGVPPFIQSGSGAYVTDVDGNRYLDFVLSWGPLILGHADARVEAATAKALVGGSSFGAPTVREVEFAELLCSIYPGLEMVRLVSSGTEATMTAVRLARGVTGRDRIIKCDGCYHGHADSLLVAAGSGVATLSIPGSPGVPKATAELTAVVPFNDLPAITKTVELLGAEQIAGIIVEPVPGNMGLILPSEGYLSGLRALCDRHNIVLIFDEVMSGFRVALGGAASRWGITPDLVTLGKVIGGGLPLAAFGGKRALMEELAPVGKVYQAGTLSGNPLAVAAGHAAVKALCDEQPYAKLEELSSMLVSGLAAAAATNEIPFQAVNCGSMFGFFFSDQPVNNFSVAKQCDLNLFTKFFNAMLERGFYFAPSAFEAGFLSTAHNTEMVAQTVEIAATVFSDLAKGS
jgi:glutamate-1-semialdehyde 2,1-aminomutase